MSANLEDVEVATGKEKISFHSSPQVGQCQRMFKVKVKVLVAQSCPILCNPMDYNLLGFSFYWILQARILEWVAISSNALKWKWSRSVVSGPQQPHGLQPSRLLCPWDFPGKSTGVGCHCPLHTSMWDECNCAVVWAFFGIAFLWDWNENWPFPVLWPLLSFPNLLAYWVEHFHSIIFQDLK